MAFDFFTWIREGVRRSVLMGVADACDELGSRPGGDEGNGMSQRITAYLQGEESQGPVRRIAGTSATSRRKLGRGLTSIEAPTQEAPSVHEG